MRHATRRLIDRSFSAAGLVSLGLMGLALAVILVPIFVKGTGAFIFKDTVERRLYFYEVRGRGDEEAIKRDAALAEQAREPVYGYLEAYEEELDRQVKWGEERDRLDEIKDIVRELLGPLPGDPPKTLTREQYGDTRWDRAQVHLEGLLYRTEYVYPPGGGMGVPEKVRRAGEFGGTALEPLFGYAERHLGEMLRPRLTFYWRFLTDAPDEVDQYFFGGIWPSLLGTLYLALGTMLIAGPVGIIAAIYLTQYAGEGRLVSVLRSCISTLAGVPSIVFALFGLAFFINALHVSKGPSVLVGCMTLSLLVLPTVIRASEEAIRAVPKGYSDASLSMGATKWQTIVKVILPASLPGIMTSIVISMGRAAGETAPIMFTAAVAKGPAIGFLDAFHQATPALSYSIYSMINTEAAIEEVRHVQYGMVLVLLAVVLFLNLGAIIARARITRKLRG